MNNNTSNLGYSKRTVNLLILGFIFVVVPFILIFAASQPGQTVHRVEYMQNSASGQMYSRTVDVTPLDPMVPYSLVVNALGWLFSLYCLYRILKTIKTDDPGHPLDIKKAVLFNLIPVFNLYWIFKWTRLMVKYINVKLSRNSSGVLSGIILLFAGLLAHLASIPPRPGTLGHAVSLALVLLVEIHFARKILRVIALDIGDGKRAPAESIGKPPSQAIEVS
jgi:hypothetical protein